MVEGSPEVFALKNGAPLVVGRAKGLSIVGSDVAALGGFAKEYAFPKDGTALCLSPKGITTVSWVEKKDFPVELSFQELDWNPQAITKAGYPHFMLKEFFEQPDALLRTLSGHVDFQREEITHPFSLLTEARAKSIRRIFLVGAGSAYHSSLITKYVWEQITGLAVECELSSEFRYRKLALDGSCLCIFISQSGETADSLAALRFARSMNAPTLVVTNVAGSSMTRECDEVFVMRCDAEICVCSTKAFTSQILALNILAHSFAKKLARLGRADERAFVKDMGHLPTAVREAIDMTTRQLASVADWQRFRTYLFIGRGDCYGLALEGALKLKEVTYLHAEGYAAGELKHGPIAVVDAHTLCFAIKGEGLLAQKTLSNMEEVRARGATVIVIGNGDVHLPEVSPRLLPFVTAIPIQYIAYSMAVLMGHDPDRPRNLAKSVTVE
jgi:glucosamine--fructose-6-phosphate aminotransferase (isomerizing)